MQDAAVTITSRCRCRLPVHYFVVCLFSPQAGTIWLDNDCDNIFLHVITNHAACYCHGFTGQEGRGGRARKEDVLMVE